MIMYNFFCVTIMSRSLSLCTNQWQQAIKSEKCEEKSENIHETWWKYHSGPIRPIRPEKKRIGSQSGLAWRWRIRIVNPRPTSRVIMQSREQLVAEAFRVFDVDHVWQFLTISTTRLSFSFSGRCSSRNRVEALSRFQLSAFIDRWSDWSATKWTSRSC